MARALNTLSSRMGIGAKIGVTLFLLVWMGIPSVMLVFLAREAAKSGRTFTWKETPCVILESYVIEPGPRSRSGPVARSHSPAPATCSGT